MYNLSLEIVIKLSEADLKLYVIFVSNSFETTTQIEQTQDMGEENLGPLYCGFEFPKSGKSIYEFPGLKIGKSNIQISLEMDDKEGLRVLPHTSRSFNDVSFKV